MVEPTEHRAVGREYLDTLTRLLQDARLADANGGLWEAADIQWWWRVDQHEDRGLQCFWTYGSTPVVAASFTNWGAGYGCDLFGTDAEVAAHSGLLWDFVRDAMPDGRIEMIIADDDHTRIDAAEAAGFVATDDLFAGARMAAGRRPRAIRSPDGYTLVSYRGGAHWMVGRNGAEVAMRLAECSLYDADLDLAVLAADGSVAGYALFWADPVTGVGLLEPMRVEAGHQGRRRLPPVPDLAHLRAAGHQRTLSAGMRSAASSGSPSADASARQLGSAVVTCARGSSLLRGRPNRAIGGTCTACRIGAVGGRFPRFRAILAAVRRPPSSSTRPRSRASRPVQTRPRANGSISAGSRRRPCATLATKSA